MLSVMVILLSVINSYRILVAMAVFSPSRAPCLVLALGRERNYAVQTAAVGFAGGDCKPYNIQDLTENKPLIHRAVDVHLQFILEVLLSRFLAFTCCWTS